MFVTYEGLRAQLQKQPTLEASMAKIMLLQRLHEMTAKAPALTKQVKLF